VTRIESVFLESRIRIKEFFQLFQERYPRATKKQLKEAFKLIQKQAAKEGKQP
jgi:hypothetical protein